jgi:hypothetical protein
MFPFLTSLFANPAMIAGTLAGSIPIVIHLLNRTKYKHIVWAAMHWLWASYKKTQRRIQIEQILLLLLRVLILVLLALALARPALQQGVGLLTGRPAVHRVIVLDNSYSMGQRLGGRPMFERAKQVAEELVSKLALSDEVDIVLGNAAYDDVLTTANASRQDTLNQIKGAQLSDGASDMPRSIAAACRLLNERGSKYQREIVVLTDMTRSAWEQSGGQWRRVQGADEAAITKAFGDPRGRPRIVLVRLRGEKDLDNVAAASLEADEKIVPANVDSQFIATVRAFTANSVKDIKVKFKVDGDEVLSQVIQTLTPQKPESVTFHHVFAEAGSHFVGVELESEGDVLPVDNTSALAIDVQDHTRVLCVDGQQRVGANSSELDFFRQALAPSKSEEINAGQMPLYPEVISDSALIEAPLEEYRLVVLANVASVPPEKMASLENYVKRGGSLWIFTGDRVDPALYNRELATLLPMQLGELTGSGDPSGEFEALSDKETTHPALEKFKGIRGLTLNHLQVYRRFKLQPLPEADPSVRTVLALENGEPLAAERRLGDRGGRVLLFATTADNAWNNFPSKNHYMPLMNFIALDLIQPGYLERNRQVGEKFTLQLLKQNLGDARREGLRLMDPAGETSAMDVLTEQFMAESGVVRRAGIYTLEVPGEKKRTVHFAATRNLEESDLTILEDRELSAALANAGEKGAFFGKSVTADDVAMPTDDSGSIEDAIRKQGGSREIWRWLAGTVLVFLFVESVLAKRFGDFTR